MSKTHAIAVIPGGHEWPYEFRMAPLSSLFVDEAYQRPLTKFVNDIVATFDPRMLLPLVLSERKGRTTLACVDGQTRMTALRQLGWTHGPAIVIRATREEEAGLFARFQLERKGIRPYHRWRAALVAKEPVAVKVEKIVNKHSYELADSGATVYPWTIQAIKACEDLAQADVLDDLLSVTSRAWPFQREANAESHSYGRGHPLNNEVIRGLASFMAKFEWEEGRLVRTLAATNPQELTLQAGHLRQGKGMGGGSQSYMREVIFSRYRKTTSKPRKAA